MTARVLDGTALSEELLAPLTGRSRKLREILRRLPRLAIIHSAADEPGRSYRQSRETAGKRCGVEVAFRKLPETKEAVLAGLKSCVSDASIDAVILDSPLLEILRESGLDELQPTKDAEGITPVNYGRFFLAKNARAARAPEVLSPCTAEAVVAILDFWKIPLAGRQAAVIGRSTIVGRPAAHWLTALDATVTLCHSRTRGLAAIVRAADIVVACAGKPGLVKGEWVKKGSAVIDAGVNIRRGKICGDVEFEGARRRASHLTPVPGGVGPVTTALLMRNVIRLAERKIRAGL